MPAPRFLAARVRVTLECPECGSPTPVNGIVPRVLCGACQSVIDVERAIGWANVFTYAAGEPCAEHLVRSSSVPRPALAYFLALGPGAELRRKWRGVLVEIDSEPLACPACRQALDVSALGREALAEGERMDAFCPACGSAVPIRAPSAREKGEVHDQLLAIACETAPRGDLAEPRGEPILFSCLGCGAATGCDATSPRVVKCSFCKATSYLPDALWLRLHPTQKKQAFGLVLQVDDDTMARAMAAARG